MYILLVICLTFWIRPNLTNCTDSDADVPLFLFRHINDTLVEIKLLIDNTQQQIRDKQSLTVPVMLEMTRAIGDHGSLDSHLAVVSFVYNRYLTLVDSLSDNLSIQMTRKYIQTINKIEPGLKTLIEETKVQQTVKLLKYVIFEIAPKIGLVTAENKSQYWLNYEWVATHLIRLQTEGCPNLEEYNQRIENILDEATLKYNRCVNDMGYLIDKFASEVADKMVSLIKEALDPSFSVDFVEPFIRDNFDL